MAEPASGPGDRPEPGLEPGRQLTDRVEIRDLEVLCFCGVLAEEQTRRQPFRLDLDIAADLAAAGTSDDLDDTVNYGSVTEAVVDAVTTERYQLVERMAHRISEIVLAYDRVEAVTVRVRKLRPPIGANVGTTGVRIHRRRSGAVGRLGASDAVSS